MLAEISQYTVFGIQLIDFENVGHLFLKLATDLFFTLIIIRLIFYPIYREINYVFTNILINVAVFLICFMMGSIKLKIGFAFGLFAVFSIIRYRTEQFPIRKMTYMFTVIISAVLNALTDDKTSYSELLIANVTILITIYLLEKNFLHHRECVQVITYEKIDLIKPERYGELIADLKSRTGLEILRAEIDGINFLNDTAKLKILYQTPNNSIPNEKE
jgi:hypothetical protein